MALFHGLAALALLVFVVGVAGRVRFWLGGAGGADAPDRGAAALTLARRSAGIILRRQTLQALVSNGLILRQVWRESRLRWLIHLTISWSFVGLFVIGSLGDMASDLGAPLRKDDAWFAAINDSLGVVLLAGVALAAGRRYLSRRPHTRTLFEDAAVLAVLGLLGVSGFLVEAGRYLKEGTPASVGGYAFVGYALSQAAEPLGWDWAFAYGWFWWVHGLLGLGLVAFIPYSKLFHIFASPVTIALDERGTRPRPSEGGGVAGEATAWPA